MERTQSATKGGYTTGFIQGYRQENGAESEGFGSSGNIEIEQVASEDSCAKRKCISLNGNQLDNFGVPVQVLSISKMSRSSRKELEAKLKTELEQIRVLQKKLASSFTNGFLRTSSFDMKQKKPAPDDLAIPEPPSHRGKKRPPVGRPSAPQLKRGPFGRFESVNHTGASQLSSAKIAGSSHDMMIMKQCATLLKRLMSHQFGWVFNKPVDVVELKIPDYLTLIKHPMDLGTIKSKLESGSYRSPLGFVEDVRLTFSNAMTYNPPGHGVHIMAETMSTYFETRWKSIAKKISPDVLQPASGKRELSSEITPAAPLDQQKRKSSSLITPKVKAEKVKRTMSDKEKQVLSRDLESLQGDIPDSIIEYLRAHSFSANQATEDEIEVDIDILGDDTLFTLRKLLDDYLQKHVDPGKAEPCEIEIRNDSGLSNSSIQPCKGIDPADEDVDIGGNDLPPSSYPPVEIEKDVIHHTDSESGSSSESGSERVQASTPGLPYKNVATSAAILDQDRSDLLHPHSGNRSVGVVDQNEEINHSKSVSELSDHLREGENAPNERQVSPEKLYRAALLRSRFADTIQKAKEKTHIQGERGDPKKLKHGKAELEKLRKEEKARLQAEAKAAEDARRQAEALAAAEAKRKRELEREAARQALQKMEKTVEINESCQFLKDLEMLGSVPVEQLPSSVDETSPDHSLDTLGGFKLIGKNPLEQLGLYMKIDDEEEECEPETIPPATEVEEGEID